MRRRFNFGINYLRILGTIYFKNGSIQTFSKFIIFHFSSEALVSIL